MSTTIAIVATHPVQYQVPWLQMLARQPGVNLKVYYAILPEEAQQGTGFGIPFKWDIPMLEGYEWHALPNTSKRPTLRGFFSNSTPAVRAILAGSRPDAVIITGWHALSLVQALWACITLRLPRIVRGESNALRRRPAWAKLLHRVFLSCFDGFLAIGKANREFYLRNGIDARKIFDCRYFIDNERFRKACDSSRKGRTALRLKWNIPDRKFCFVFVGKFEPKKRLLDLLDALESASRARNDLHLLAVGAGELDAAAKTRVDAAGLPVSFSGFLNQTELPQAYAASDCLVLPSDDGETWGLVVNEAMACRLPAIVSDRVGCGPDLVESGVTGFVFPFGNIPALSACLVAMAADRAKAASMGHEAEVRIGSYSVENAAKATIQAVEFVLSNRN